MADGDSMVTIVHVVESTLAGVGRHVIDLSRAQGAAGHQVHVIYSPLREDDRFHHGRKSSEDVTFHSLKMRRSPTISDLSARRRLRALLADIEPDVIHAHSSKAGLLARSLRRLPETTLLYTPHAIVTLNPTLSPLQRRIASTVERGLARRTDHVIAVSEHELAHLDSIGIPSSRTRLVPNGIELAGQRPFPTAARQELGLPPDGRVVGFVGRLVPQKNPMALLAALPFLDRDIHLAVVGDGPLRAVLAASDLNTEGRMHLLGERDGHAAMFGFDCLVLPSLFESAPYVILEALDAGIPVVITADAKTLVGWEERIYRSESASGPDLAIAIQQGLAGGRRDALAELPTIDSMAADLEALFWYRR